jgi:C1A family cysteine protease
MTVRYTWKASTPDHRDYAFSLQAPAVLPSIVPPFDGNNPVEDQGQLGSCTGNSSTTALEIVTKSNPLSRLMAYYNARIFEGTTRQDAGAELRDVIKGFQTYGVCEEINWPYIIKKFKTKPTKSAYKKALAIQAKIKSYERVTSLTQFKIALAAGLPVIFGFSVPDYFESAEVANTGYVRFPTALDSIIGGHAVVAVGYDDTKQIIWVRNSWGKDWGLNGDFQMDYQWFDGIDSASSLVADCWVIHPQ